MNPLRQTLYLLLSAFLTVFGCAAHAQDKPDYLLATGDSVHIQVFQNPDLSIDARVSETGSISYPLIGAVDIGGLSTMAAEKRLADALQKGGFLQNPQVTVTLVQVRGNQVSVLGQVNRPGRFPLESINTRLSDMLANAGGTTPLGDDTVIVSGVRNGKPFRQTVDVPALFLEDKGAGDLVLQGGDVVYVNKAPVFYIYGEAQRPGSYRIERGMTVMQALAQGGGPSARGSERRLRLHRKGTDGSVQQIEPQLTDAVQSDDVIYVKESIF
ncbi:polysaccharide export protein EpsE [Rhodoferax sp. GW822-FHT02A01]|uniref:polysaccharide export protein EpsE n=1 Tax=Rhodoferax sp. GW822-FHT02A01 TaxID=3141537 RepID=UPI00315DDDD9